MEFNKDLCKTSETNNNDKRENCQRQQDLVPLNH